MSAALAAMVLRGKGFILQVRMEGAHLYYHTGVRNEVCRDVVYLWSLAEQGLGAALCWLPGQG